MTFYANKITGKCTDPCPDGTYPDSTTKSCIICQTTCLTCTGPLDTDCVLCYPHATKTSGKCKCDLTYYPVSVTSCTTPQLCLSCNSCSSGCEVCGSDSSTDCSSCITNYFLLNLNSVRIHKLIIIIF